MGEFDLIRAKPEELLSLVIWLVIFALPVLGRILQAVQKRGSTGTKKPGAKPRRRARDEWARRIREAMEEAGAEFPQPTPVEDRSAPVPADVEPAQPSPAPQKKRAELRSVFQGESGGGGLSTSFSESIARGKDASGAESPLGGAFENTLSGPAQRTMGGLRGDLRAQGSGREVSTPGRAGGLGGALGGLSRGSSKGPRPSGASTLRSRFRGGWAEAIVRAEILAPPVALRGENSSDANPGLRG